MPSNNDIGVADPLFAHYDAASDAPAALALTGAMADQRPQAHAMVGSWTRRATSRRPSRNAKGVLS